MRRYTDEELDDAARDAVAALRASISRDDPALDVILANADLDSLTRMVLGTCESAMRLYARTIGFDGDDDQLGAFLCEKLLCSLGKPLGMELGQAPPSAADL